jgi:hypothetical protein
MSKTSTKIFTFLAVVALAAAVSARAGDSETITIGHDATVGGAFLAAGDYVVKWKSHSPEAEVTFQSAQSQRVETKAAGRLEKRNLVYDHHTVVYEEAPDGSRKLVELRFGGTNRALVFTPPSAAAQTKKVTGDRTARRIPEYVPGFGTILDYDWAPNPIQPSPNASPVAAPGKRAIRL